MKSLILYDSMGGNTEKVAGVIYRSLSNVMTPHMQKVEKEIDTDILDYDLVFIGSPVIDWLPSKGLMSYVKSKMKDYNKRGQIKPSSPLIPGKFGVSFGTFAGPHIGGNEALPMTMWLNSFLEHLGYTVMAQWHVVGKHHHNQEINLNGRLGNISDRPNASDLLEIENRVNGLLDSLSHW